jgi:HEAT repeat protein
VKFSDPELRQAIIQEALKVRTQGRIKTTATPVSTEEFNYLTAWAKSQAWYLNAAIISAHRASDEAQRAIVLDKLLAALRDIQVSVRLAAIESVAFLPTEAVTPQIIAELRPLASDPDDQIRASTLRTLAKIDNSAETLQLLAAGLRAQSLFVAEASAEALKDFDVSMANDGQLLSVVSPMLTDDNQEVRRIGMRVFPYISKDANEKQVNTFIRQASLDSEVAEVVFTRGASELLVSEVLVRMSHPSVSRHARQKIVSAIGNLSPDRVRKHDAIANIISLLPFEDDPFGLPYTEPFMLFIQPSIEESLLKLSRQGLAAEVTETLTALLNIGSSKVQVRVLGVLCRLHAAHAGISLPEEVASKLVKLLDDYDPLVRAVALSILLYESIRDGLKAEQQQHIRTKLLALIQDRDLRVRSAAWRAGCAFGSAEFNPQLIDMCLRDLNSRDFNKIAAAVHTLVYLPGIRERKDISQKLMKLIVKERPFGVFHFLPGYDLGMTRSRDFRIRVVEVVADLVREEISEELFDSVLKMISLADYSLNYLKDPLALSSAKAGQYLPPSYVVDRLAPFLQSYRGTHRLFGLYVLAAIPWNVVPPAVIAHCIALLDDKGQLVRMEAVDMASGLLRRTQSKSLLSAIRKRLEDESPGVRERAWNVIEEYNREQGVWAEDIASGSLELKG